MHYIVHGIIYALYIYTHPMTGIYDLENPVGEHYIGQSRDLEGRFLSHMYTPMKRLSALHSSKERYGRENHLFMVLHELPDDVSQEVLDRYECLFIECYQDAGYKLLNIKEGGFHGKHTEETKVKMCRAQRNRRQVT
jgi:group I intron endonuclease